MNAIQVTCKLPYEGFSKPNVRVLGHRVYTLLKIQHFVD